MIVKMRSEENNPILNKWEIVDIELRGNRKSILKIIKKLGE